jgi:hypothetical protein
MNSDNEILRLYNQLNEVGKDVAKSIIIQLSLIGDAFTKAENRKTINFPKVKKREPTNRIIRAPEGTLLPEDIIDLRPILRRDGLILLSWKQKKSDPCKYDIFWITKTGKRFVYAARYITEDALYNNVMPTISGSGARGAFADEYDLTHEFDCIVNWVYVAPEEIIKGSATSDPRIEYIQKLEAMGIDTGPDIIFRMRDKPITKKAV